MKIITVPALILLLAISACSADNSLKGVFTQQMKADEVDGFTIIHIEENDSYGLVLYTAWTREYPDNKNRPGINYFVKSDGGWDSRPGTSCSDSGISRLGLEGGEHLFCSTLKKNMQFEKVQLGGSDTRVFTFGDDRLVWFAVTDDQAATVTGITPDGGSVRLN